MSERLRYLQDEYKKPMDLFDLIQQKEIHKNLKFGNLAHPTHPFLQIIYFYCYFQEALAVALSCVYQKLNVRYTARKIFISRLILN